MGAFCCAASDDSVAMTSSTAVTIDVHGIQTRKKLVTRTQ